MTRNKKQALFLVLALAVLGVSLFTLFRKPAPPTAKKEATQTAQAKQPPKPTEQAEADKANEAAQPPQTGTGRNPFAAPPGVAATGQPAATGAPPEPDTSGAVTTQEPPPGPPRPAAVAPPGAAGAQTQPTISLSGIVTGQPSVAVIYYGDQRRYARVGERVGDYRVQTIGRQEVVLVGPTGKLILRMGGRH
jgi:hypothetical protein